MKLALFLAFAGICGAVTTLDLNSGGPTVGGFTPDAPYCTGTAYGPANQSDLSGMTGVYQTLRYGIGGTSFSCNIPAPNGTCDVTLDFIEPNKSGTNQRIFTVTVNGETTGTLDLYDLAGGKLMEYQDSSLTAVPVTDGFLRFLFVPTAGKGNAVISAIETSCTPSDSTPAASGITVDTDGTVKASVGLTFATPSGPTFNAGGTTTCDFAASNFCGFTMTGDTTLAVTHPHGSGPYALVVTMDGTGGRTLTYPSSFTAGNFCSPSGTASKKTVVFFMYDGSANYYQMACTSNDTFSAFPELTSTGSASSKKVVCVDTATGRMYASSTSTDCSN